jgi:anaerobic ribonucleoside-triphosphate reductase activating protein
MADDILRLHHFLPTSRANGPGLRAVVWVQGCTLGCPGCFNPQTHPAQGGERVSVEDLFDQIISLGDSIEGITLSGGEPFQQTCPVLGLLKRVRAETSLSALVFSGYAWEEIQQFPAIDEIRACVDVLIAGRYDSTQALQDGLVSSANQQAVFLTHRYAQADLDAVPPAEVILMPNGEIVASGVGGLDVNQLCPIA